MSDVPISLHRYRFGDDAVPDLAPQVTALTYVQDINGRDDMQFSIASSVADAKRIFAPGDYAVLRDALGYTMSWGRVLTRSTRIRRVISGELTMQPYPVTVAGWFDYLARNEVRVLMAGTTGPRASRVGNVWPVQLWQSMTAELIAMYGQLAGAQLQFLFRSIGNVEVPAQLGGGNLGDLIPVVYDEETALRYAPRFKGIEPVDTGRLAPDRLAAPYGAKVTTVGNLLRSTFVCDPSIIELFPALVEGGTEPYNSLASVLGKRPVLVYRVKPWREEPLWKNVVAKAVYTYEDFEASVLSGSLSGRTDDGTDRMSPSAARIATRARNRKLLVSDKMFSRTSLNSADPGVMVPIHENYVRSIDSTIDDSNRVNGVTINVTPLAGGAVAETLGDSDLPILIDDQIEKHGLRMLQASWPMTGPEGDADPAFYRAAAAQSMQFNMMNHVLESGVMKLNYTAATVVRENKEQAQTQAVPVYDLNPGQWFRTKVGDLSEYIGYVNALQHAMAFHANGTRAVETTVQFVRGHHVEAADLVKQCIVPVGSPETAALEYTDAAEQTMDNGQMPQDRLTRAAYSRVRPQPLTSDVGKYFWYQGNKIPTDFTVVHMPVDLTGTIANPYYQQFRSNQITKCVVHTLAGSRKSTATSIYNHFTRSVRSGNGVAAHVGISPDGTVTQYFDLAVNVSHAGGIAGDATTGRAELSFNNTSVSVELNIPAPEKNAILFAAYTSALGGPWPSAEEWRWWYTNRADATNAYNFGRKVAGQYGPTKAQLASFKAVALAYHEHFDIPLAGIPRDKSTPASAVRSKDLAVIAAQWANPAWGFYHHAQLSSDRADAAGVDIPGVFGQPLVTVPGGI